MNSRVFILEDDPSIRKFISKKLTQLGYEVQSFESVEQALTCSISPDLWLVDVLLIGELTGLDFVKKLRTTDAQVPVLILSALTEPSDRIKGLESGADDYLPKPFETQELLLRIEGMLKRRSWYKKLPHKGAVYSWQGREIDFVHYEARRGTQKLALGQKEAMVMKLLVEREGEVVSREEILNHVWGYDSYPSTRTVDNFIVRLRKYFEDEPSHPRFIHSIRGTGYKFTSGNLGDTK